VVAAQAQQIHCY